MLKTIAIIPAYNEAENIALVVGGLLELLDHKGSLLIQEVIVADNGSEDATAAIAIAAGATVLRVAGRGYGNACAAACALASTRPHADVLLFADGDHTADLSEATLLLDAIASGADLAIGVRTRIAQGSLTLAQRWGNALACFLVRRLWRIPISDLGPFRAIRRSAYERMSMRDRAYGWTVEMQIRAAQLHLTTTEVAVSWLARRAGHSKISGTLSGVMGAARGILSMIARLWWREWWEWQARHGASPLCPAVVANTVAILPAGQAQLTYPPRRQHSNQTSGVHHVVTK